MSTKNASLPQAAAYTSTGRVRNHNEDAFGLRPERGIFVVCDGMGGAAGGEVASRIAVDTVLHRVLAAAPGDGPPPAELLNGAVDEANAAVLARAQADPGLYGMGTTLVALLLQPGSAFIAHAGDSRCYLYRDGHLSRCTHDHSLVDEQIRLGTMTQEEAERSPFRSVITRAIGTQQSVTPDLQEMPLHSGDRFLLCSDGLTREISEEQIEQVFAAHPGLDAAAHQLVDAATEAGGRDNITCLLVQAP